MTNLTNYPYPEYESNKAVAGIFASLIGISLIAWIVQSIRAHIKLRRPIILLLVGHLTIFSELVVLAALSTDTRNSKTAFTAITVLLAIGQRMIILANYDFLTQLGNLSLCASRAILIGSVLGAVGSAIIMSIAGKLSYSTDTIDESFRLRQVSAAIVLCMTVLFYPIWFITKTARDMTKRAIILLIISSLTSLIVAIFLQVTSIPDYYLGANQQEFWFYIFQLIPIAIALFIWNILHPKRSLLLTQQREDDSKRNIDISL